jgi:hypothetical protein
MGIAVANNDRNSQLQKCSIGIVVRDKEEGSDVIEVWPSEILPQVNDNIRDQSTDYNVKGPDARGISSQTKLSGGKTIKATWLAGDDGNRMTSPDVYANETVDIYRFGDTDTFYWKTTYREPKLRKKETVCYAYSNKDSQDKPHDKESSYWYEVSTKDGNKHIQFHTSNNDGEKFAYDLIINPDTSTATLMDSNGNKVLLESELNRAALENSVGSKLELVNNVVTGSNPDGSKVVLDGPNGTLDVPGSAIVTGGQNLTLKSQNIGFDAAAMSMNSGGSNTEMNFQGNMNFTGNMSFNGKMTVNGEFIYNGEELTQLIHRISQK